jgi:hypothetical protein
MRHDPSNIDVKGYSQTTPRLSSGEAGKGQTTGILQNNPNMSIRINDIAQFDDIRMMHSPQNRNFPIDLIHSSLGIHALLANELNSDLRQHERPKGNLHAIAGRLSWFRPSPS